MALTRRGGHLWETERAPPWEHFCISGTAAGASGKVRVAALDAALARAYLDTAVTCGLIAGKPAAITMTSRRRSRHLVPRRSFTLVSVLEVELTAGSAALDVRRLLARVQGRDLVPQPPPKGAAILLGEWEAISSFLL